MTTKVARNTREYYVPRAGNEIYGPKIFRMSQADRKNVDECSDRLEDIIVMPTTLTCVFATGRQRRDKSLRLLLLL